MTDPDLKHELSEAAQDGFNHAVEVLVCLTKFVFVGCAWLLIGLGKFLIAAEAHISDRRVPDGKPVQD